MAPAEFDWVSGAGWVVAPDRVAQLPYVRPGEFFFWWLIKNSKDAQAQMVNKIMKNVWESAKEQARFSNPALPIGRPESLCLPADAYLAVPYNRTSSIIVAKEALGNEGWGSRPLRVVLSLMARSTDPQ